MHRILITSGPTREYLDPVRFLTNGSSGRMGLALAEAVLKNGNLPVIVSGTVAVSYPDAAEVHWVETTSEMLRHCVQLFPTCKGIIAAAAPCDFRPEIFSEQKLHKTKDGTGITLRFQETPDILARLGQMKQKKQWSIGFALETENGYLHAAEKLQRKNCNLIVLNSPASISNQTSVFEVFDASGVRLLEFSGSKSAFADALVGLSNQIE